MVEAESKQARQILLRPNQPPFPSVPLLSTLSQPSTHVPSALFNVRGFHRQVNRLM
jgi:hypothetical protein